MSLPDLLKQSDFIRIPADDPASIDGLVTWQFGNAKAVIRGERLECDGSRVFRYMAEGKELTLHKLYVPAASRRNGQATQLIEKLLAATDAEGFALYLEPLPYERPATVTKEALRAFYERFGFLPTDGTVKVLRRTPKAEA